MRKFAGFLIFVGLLLIGGSYYQKYIGDIPFIENLKEITTKEDSEIVGPPIKVERINSIEYKTITGKEYEVNKENLADSVSTSAYIKFKIGNDAYRLSFKYPEFLRLLKGDEDTIVFGDDAPTANISFAYSKMKYDEYLNYRNDFGSDGDYFLRRYEVKNDISKIVMTKVSNGNDSLFLDKMEYMIYDINDVGNPLLITILTKNKKIPDSLVLNFYNSFKFEKINNDLEFCKLENGKYVCTFKLNNYDNSSKKKVSLEFDSELYDIEVNKDALIPSAVSIKTKEGSKDTAEVSFNIVYDGTTVTKNYMEASNFEEKIINGRKFMVRNYVNYQNKKVLYYEVQPNIYVKISMDTSDGFFDTVYNTFINFKVK